MRKFIMFFAFLASANSFSQELAGTFKIKLNKNRIVVQMVDENQKQIGLLVSDAVASSCYQFDKNLTVTDSLKTIAPDKKYGELLGFNSKDNKYQVFWGSNKNKEIFSQFFDFKFKTTTSQVLKFDFSKQLIIQKLTLNNKFYIISLVKNTNFLKIYNIDDDGRLEVKTIDATSSTLINSYGEVTSLYAMFEESFFPYEREFSLQYISDATPNSLTFAAYKRKMYTSPTEIIFSFDNNFQYTQLFKINLADFTISRKLYPQPIDGFPPSKETYDSSNYDPRPDINSNSFLVNQTLFQIRLCPELVQVTIKDLEGQELKSFKAKPDTAIDFKNSEIIQENGSLGKVRILESSNQFIRKLYNSNPGISCYFDNGSYFATIGSVSEVQQDGSAAIMGGMFGVAGILIAAAITANSSVENYNSYQNRKIVYVNSLFDANFNHIAGKSKPLAFDRLRKYAFDNKLNSDLTIFKFNSKLFLGSYDKKQLTYSFIRFDE